MLLEKEKNSNKFTPRFRTEDIGDNNKSYSINELSDLMIKNIKKYPQEPLPLSIYLSKRPKFKG